MNEPTDRDGQITDRLLADNEDLGMLVHIIPSLVDQLDNPDDWLQAAKAWAAGVEVNPHHLGHGWWHASIDGVSLPLVRIALGRGY